MIASPLICIGKIGRYRRPVICRRGIKERRYLASGEPKAKTELSTAA